MTGILQCLTALIAEHCWKFNMPMNKDELIKARIEDLIARCRDGYYVSVSGFMDTHEQAIARAMATSAASSGVTVTFYGGYDDAERRIMVCAPEDWYTDDFSEYLRVLRVSVKKGSKPLTHRDYLGSILGLGLERVLIGDILTRKDGADIVVSADIADFLLTEYTQVGRAETTREIVSPEEIILPEMRKETIRDTVPSARLDSVISSAFKVSRANAAEAIRRGIVSVNHLEVTKPDARVDEGSVLVLKGKGKAILREIGGESKKGRLWITIERFL